MKRLVSILLAFVFLTSCSNVPFMPQSCAQQSATFLTAIQGVAREWDDAANLAGQTPRMSLPAQIDKLQAIRRKAQDVPAPACAKPAQDALVQGMDQTISTYLKFLSQAPDADVQAGFQTAAASMKTFADEIAAINTK